MSSSQQQQSTNPNNNQPQNTQPQPQIPSNYQYNDYIDDPSISFNNLNIGDQSSNVISGDYDDPTGQTYTDEYTNTNDEADDDLPIDVEAELEAELEARAEMLNNEQFDDNDEDETVYSDAVQNAFENYENEYSKLWTQNEPIWNNFSNNEHEEMLEQMRECMFFLSQEYTTAEMPNHLIDRTQESKLNPDAVEFRPPWLPSPTSTDKELIVVTSWTPCEAKKQEEE